ncbi:MAG TPA: DUF3467 domain-containing protein [Bryobacteraceae bacterium]|nr:DUF3467 domain-containing protein [Bryobacteraceae bacterium]
MESEIKKSADPELPLEVPEDGIFEAYANIVDADWSLTDVTLRFMLLAYGPREDGSTTKNRELIVLEKANITIPWWHTKVLANMLTNLIQSYEATNGELKEPKLTPRPELRTQR